MNSIFFEQWMYRANLLKLFKSDEFIEGQSHYGIKLQFNSTSKNLINTTSQTKIHIPLLLITYDHGYFKRNFVIHCSKTLLNENLNSFQDKSNMIIEPIVKVENNILSRLDQSFYQYCVYLEDKFEKGLLSTVNSISPSSSEIFSDNDLKENQIYLICFRKEILFRNLLENIDWPNLKDQSKKNIFFCNIREIGFSFNSPESIIPITNVNILYINNIF